jgi:isoaspartyl peptidase/L-asparaginase-like protein (Ntn-hydrolase superfamily)
MIFVHAGAGYHDSSLDYAVKSAMRTYEPSTLALYIFQVLSRACQRSLEVMNRTDDAIDGVVEAIVVMEDDINLNAGTLLSNTYMR